jgi:hypothetical protein
VRLPYSRDFLISEDYLYTFTDLGIWSTIEIGAGLSASCLATLKPLLRKIRTSYASSDSSVKSASKPGSIPGMYRPDLSDHYAMVSITSGVVFTRLEDADAIDVRREIVATDHV